jgi:hypothetical protein
MKQDDAQPLSVTTRNVGLVVFALTRPAGLVAEHLTDGGAISSRRPRALSAAGTVIPSLPDSRSSVLLPVE